MNKRKGSILIIDDNKEILKALELFLEDFFEKIVTESNPKKIPNHIKQRSYDLYILDMNFTPGENSGKEGIFWIDYLKKIDPEALIICMTAYGEIELSVQAMKMGATDFIAKPWNDNKLLETIISALKLKTTQKGVKERKKDSEFILGKSDAMKRIFEIIKKVGQTNANILILGENGTGKDLLAKEIFDLSNCNNHVFVKVDLGALSETLFESELFGHVKGAFTDAKNDRVGYIEEANNGTLFLDEISNIPDKLQSKLLTALQNRQINKLGSTNNISVNIRLISATNADLRKLVNEKSFREDLLYRINTIQIEIPPLRERLDDIPILFNSFLEYFSDLYGKTKLEIPKEIYESLSKYSWPGNVRELKHVVEKAVILSSDNKLNINDFVFPGQKLDIIESISSLKLDDNERYLIIKAIRKSENNLSKAAIELGITRKTLYNKIEKYGIKSI